MRGLPNIKYRRIGRFYKLLIRLGGKHLMMTFDTINLYFMTNNTHNHEICLESIRQLEQELDYLNKQYTITNA
jgi:hypothetical protein